MFLSDSRVRPIDLYRLERGDLGGVFSEWDPRTDGYEVIVVEPGGAVRWKYQRFEASGPAPWNNQISNMVVEKLTWFIHPQPGVSYGEVVHVFDWVRTQTEYGGSFGKIHFVTCEDGPEAWDPWDVGPSTEPIRTMSTAPQFPSIEIDDTWILPPPEILESPTEGMY